MRVMQQRFGAGVRQEVLGEVISQSFQEAVVSENFRPAGQPNIEARKMDAGQDVEYTATFEVFPTVEISAIDDLSIEKPVAEVTDADMTTLWKFSASNRASWLLLSELRQRATRC